LVALFCASVSPLSNDSLKEESMSLVIILSRHFAFLKVLEAQARHRSEIG